MRYTGGYSGRVPGTGIVNPGESMKRFEGYMHGVNLGGWLSQCDHTRERYDSFICRDDIERIAEKGMDHVRVPVDYEVFERAEGFSYTDRLMDWAEAAGLNVILDLHKTYGFSFDSGEGEDGFFDREDYQEKFYELWEKLAQRYGTLYKRLCFELLNEVTDKEYCDRWNSIAEKCVSRIRGRAGEIKILFGGYHNNSIEAVGDLALPFDENIVYNFHCYEPLIFTHQGGHWVPGMDRAFRMPFDSTYGEYKKNSQCFLDCFSVTFDGYDENAGLGEEFFENLVKKAVDVAQERDVPLYCGEFGVIDLASPEDTLSWYRMICSVFDKYGIARAAWSYKEMDFGIFDERLSGVFDELVRVI